MEKNKIIGAVLLVGGIALASYGFNLQETFAWKFKDFFGNTDHTSTIYIVLGALASVFGVIKLLSKGK